MAELLVKIACAAFKLKLVLNYYAVKCFHLYRISDMLSVHSTDSIYPDLGSIVVLYLKR